MKDFGTFVHDVTGCFVQIRCFHTPYIPLNSLSNGIILYTMKVFQHGEMSPVNHPLDAANRAWHDGIYFV